ncbi:MAG TPA: hypothetical protein VKG25_00170, partial [Bryobacteraceae bacterium]|nr:hypothetical protein [Bryobacteraceae bacterium]
MTRYTCFQPVAGLTAALFAFTLGYTGFAQNLSGLPPAGPGHEFTESNLVGSWVTLHKEFLNFQATGKVYFDKEKGEKRQGDWSVSNGTIWVTWSGAAGPTLMPMLVTAFNEGAIRVEGQGGKVLAVMVRRSAGETSRHSVPMAVKPLAMPLPHLDDHGGPIADHPSNHAMYWHSDWDSVHSDPQFKRGNIDGWLSDFMASNYFDKSNQYGTNSGSFAGSAGNFSLFPDPGGTTDSGLIAAWAFGMIQTPFTGVPYPCSSNDVYTVMLPKDTTIDNGFNKTCSSFGAYHLFGPVVVPPTAFGIGPCGIF